MSGHETTPEELWAFRDAETGRFQGGRIEGGSEYAPVDAERFIGVFKEQMIDEMVLVGVHPRHRDDLKACREFIEGIASGRFRPTMEDARKFLAGVDAEKAKGE